MATSKNRRLVAILFADIVGYTTVMQENEKEGLALIKYYREVLYSTVTAHHGEIIQHYGDGSLIIFSSGIAALGCAKQLQEICQQTTPKIPLRIGIHIGDIVVEGDNIFGDGVNLAARIESLSEEGAILFSKRLLPDLKSHPEFKVAYIGKFDLKNIAYPVEVFALANEGFPVPNSKELRHKLHKDKADVINWQIPTLVNLVVVIIALLWYHQVDIGPFKFSQYRANQLAQISGENQSKVAVMTFDNQTNKKELESYGVMISDWLTTGLMEVEELEVISAANMSSSAMMASTGLSLPEASRFDILVQGRFYKEEENIIIQCNVIHSKDGKVLHALDPIKSKEAELMMALEELKQRLLGYWELSDNNKYKKKIPKYEAYLASLKANEYYYEDNKKVEDLLIQAHQLDTTFAEPLLKLAKYYYTRRKFSKCDSLIAFLQQQKIPLTEFEELRMKAIAARSGGQFETSAQYNLQIAERYDPSYYNNAVGRLLAANNVSKALHYSTRTQDLKEIGKIAIQQEGTVARPLFIQNRLGNYQQMVRMVETVLQNEQHTIRINSIPSFHLRALLQLGEMKKAQQTLDFYLDKNNPKIDYANKGSYKTILRWFCYDLFRMDRKVSDLRDRLLENDLDFEWYYINGAYEKCIPLMEAKLEKYPQSKLYLAIMGKLYALLGQEDIAEAYIVKINSFPELYKKGDNAYSEAIIRSSMNQKKMAVNLLKKAHADGYDFSDKSFQYDPRLKDLYGYPAFEEFVQPK